MTKPIGKHTPGPWVYTNSGLIDCIFAEDLPLGDSRLAEMIGPNGAANAAFIVRAVNNHERLVEAAKAVLEDLQHGQIHAGNQSRLHAALRDAEEEGCGYD